MDFIIGFFIGLITGAAIVSGTARKAIKEITKDRDRLLEDYYKLKEEK